MIRAVVVGAVLILGIASVGAQQDPIGERKALMKRSGAQAAAAAKMVRGEEPFDLAKAQAALAAFADKAEKMPNLFPDNTKTGDTRAVPAIWDNRAGFNAEIAKFAGHVKEAQSSTKDLETFRAAMTTIGRDCGSCHQGFRK